VNSTTNEELENLRNELIESQRIVDELQHDELTGLYTRAAFLRWAEEMLIDSPEKQYGILSIDIENFKSANAIYGEEMCNEFLVYVAKVIEERFQNHVTGRFGGDQFVVLVHAEHVSPEIIAEHEKAILENAPIPNQIIKFGVYAPIDRELLIVRCCDRAFHALKAIKGVYGKNIAFYEEKSQRQILEDQKLVESMENGLQESQFKVYYQPKHDSVTGNIAGAEALVRWVHPDYGFMTPNQFIPLFEKNGFITKLDYYILDRVCSDIKKWQNDGITVVPVSVNISRRDFFETGSIERFMDLIEDYGINHNLIHVEITESIYSENTDIIIKKVRNIQDAGFKIEMDDFGAGYSSLGLLSTFPLNIIKLDISFVRNIEVNEIVIENMIKMAHKMGLFTVAEGVETEKQYKILKGLGCDIIQGFYFSKALPEAEYEIYLRNSVAQLIKPEKKAKRASSDHFGEDILLAANEIADGIPGGFFSYHADGEYEIISFNKEILSIYDCKTAQEFRDFTRNSFKGMVHKEDIEAVFKSIGKQITSENSLDYVEYRIETKTGKVKYVQDYGRLVMTERYGSVFYVFVRDVTEIKQQQAIAEQERIVKLELERDAMIAKSSNQAKNIFMVNLTSEILPKIKAIVERREFIENNLGNDKLLRETLELEKKGEEQLLGFVNNLREFSQLETGEIKLREVPTDISLAMERTYDIFADEIEKKHLKVEYWSDIYNPFIYQDVQHTVDVVLNIIKNAIKYTPEGGEIRFGLKQRSGPTEDTCYIDFTCEDNGIGISKEFLPYAKEPFSREDNEINKSISGSGLGLNIANCLMELLCGTLEIKSEQGKGTTVLSSQMHRFAPESEVVDNAATLINDIKN